MIPSRMNSIWGRNYDLGQNANYKWQFLCSSGGRPYGMKKRVTLGLAEFNYHPIEVDRAEFARMLKKCRKEQREKAKEK